MRATKVSQQGGCLGVFGDWEWLLKGLRDKFHKRLGLPRVGVPGLSEEQKLRGQIKLIRGPSTCPSCVAVLSLQSALPLISWFPYTQ